MFWESSVLTMDEAIPGWYRHYKGGEYLVIGIALHSETKDRLVIYVDVHNQLWARPLDMFNQWVDVNGERVRRYEYMGELTNSASDTR